MDISQSIIIISIIIITLALTYSAGAICEDITERSEKHGKKKTNTIRRK